MWIAGAREESGTTMTDGSEASSLMAGNDIWRGQGATTRVKLDDYRRL